MSELTKYIENLALEFDRLSFDDMKVCSGNERLLFLYAYYHYFNADSSSILDILQGNVSDSNAPDQLSGIYIDQDSDNSDVDDVISLSFDEISKADFIAKLKIFKDIETMLFASLANKHACRDQIRRLLLDEDYVFSDKKPLKILLITSYSPTTAKDRKDILKVLKDIKPNHDNVTYCISFGFEIENEILEIENPKQYVETGALNIDKPDNLLSYGSEGSIIVNAAASSIKSLYQLYAYRGLFAQNLRYYVKNEKVDNNIVNSMHEQPDNFWYFNNGIIIICDDYAIAGTQITISRFSIINGGQTTKLIGETDFDEDFFVQCKIVKNKYADEESKVEFISQVAEASNTQKPIKDKDLIANRVEQRLLKKQLAEAGIFCQIKRGDKVNKKVYPAAWQNTTNEELGQFLLAFVYQQPGIAKANKASICGNAERYNLLYGKTYNSFLIEDLLKIKAYYKLWMSYNKKHNTKTDPYRAGIINNGMLFTFGIIGVIAKLYYHPEYTQKLKSLFIPETKIEIYAQHDLSHRVFKQDMDKQAFYDLFEYCYRSFFRPGYDIYVAAKGSSSSYANFTKVNKNYITFIFTHTEAALHNGIPQAMREEFEKYFYSATSEDISNNEVLLHQYINTVVDNCSKNSVVPKEVRTKISASLTKFRDAVSRKTRTKQAEVLLKASITKIAVNAPLDFESLNALHCLTEEQLENYGEDIIKIILSIVSPEDEN